MNRNVMGALALALPFLAGCQSTDSQASSAPQQEPVSHEVEESKPLLVKESETMSVFQHLGRYYLVSSSSSASFAKHGHLPYTRTLLGEGPLGETVVVEIDKSNADLADELYESFIESPILVGSQGEDFFVFAKDGRHYVVGSQLMADKFAKHGHLPYTRTLLGEGRQNQTLVLEVDKKNEALTDRLMAAYQAW